LHNQRKSDRELGGTSHRILPLARGRHVCFGPTGPALVVPT